MKFRPKRLVIKDELDRPRTLNPNAFSLIKKADSGALLFLGLGSDPLQAVKIASKFSQKVFWIECPAFEKQMPLEWHNSIPKNWTRLRLADIAQSPHFSHIFHYTPGSMLFSLYWGQILALIESKTMRSDALPSLTILLPSAKNNLLSRELDKAIQDNGFKPAYIRSTSQEENLPTLEEFLRTEKPLLFLSVNLLGLDPEGRDFRLLQALNIPVAIWCVDNPWHQFSALRLPWWKEAFLFVTDSTFVEPLRHHGVKSVWHLPLAAWQCMDCHPYSESLSPLVFVGRSAFPDKAHFFAGCHIPENLHNAARMSLLSESNSLPNVTWWQERFGIKICWPDKSIRLAGLGAEECSVFRRSLWLKTALQLGLTLFGDDGWKTLLPHPIDLRPPVDYYHSLFSIYASARYNLNITSLLLPAGLTQRHFDVWMAGGFLITDATKGLDIFPKELVEPIQIKHHSELLKKVNYLEKNSHFRSDFINAWQSYLSQKHTYAMRLQEMFEKIFKI